MSYEVRRISPFNPERMKERRMTACEAAQTLIDWLPREDY